ncbi:Patatin-like protein 3 [Dichanthelium oligosanthes]|uniref:Patatin n=1 Tax=Dichanthelium oligosanthes TaxID=888268 RepID=A0A1E5V4U1_9POAL|nr:Patatin-like protein 3 [Dichanthelium oligosanthes]
MATASLALRDQTLLPSPASFGASDRLSQEIFSILESNFLFGASSPLEGSCSVGRVRVLSIDGGADGGALAAAALARLERRLQELSGNPTARVADFFDLAAGSGAGGFLAAALFACRMPADAARDVVAKNRKVLSGRGGRGGLFRRPEAVFRKVFGDLTVRDAAKPLLIPCYDMASAAPFVFSRADAVEAEAFDFPLWQVCAAACGVGPAEVASLDGRTRLRAAAAAGGGGSASAAVANPTAVAVTHVLHNKREFPFAAGAGDLVVLSLGGSAAASLLRPSSSSLLRIAGACQADMVDQAVSMAFGESRATNYIRIQGNGIAAGETAEAALTERGVESVLFRGKKLMAQTNGERLDGVAEQLVQEHHRRLESKTPVVLVKPSATPRTSSSSASTLITVSTNSSSESP